MLKSKSIVDVLLPLFWLGSVGKCMTCAAYWAIGACKSVDTDKGGVSGGLAITDDTGSASTDD